MGGANSGRRPNPNNVYLEQTPIASNDLGNIIIPDLSGDHSAGSVETTPVQDLDLVNKKYVDDNAVTPAGNDGDIQVKSGTNFASVGMNLSNDGTKTTFLGTAGDYNRIGDAGTTSHGLNSEDDLLVTGDLEVNGKVHFDNTVKFYTNSDFHSSFNIFDGAQMNILDSGYSGAFKFRGMSTETQALFEVAPSFGRQIVIGNYQEDSHNYDHSAQTNPTLFIHSATDPDTDNTQWLSLTHDQTNGVISTGKGDLNIACPTDKTIELQEAVYKDINMAGYLLGKPASSAPGIVTFLDESGTDTTIETYGFAVDDKVHGGFELQHDYKEGTDLIFHVHWQGITAPSGTDNVQWRLNYIVMRDGETLDAAVVIDSPDTVFDTQYETVRTDFAAITGTNFLMGDQFMFTLTRVTATGDAYAGEALIATAGIHYQVDTIGSRQITAK